MKKALAAQHARLKEKYLGKVFLGRHVPLMPGKVRVAYVDPEGWAICHFIQPYRGMWRERAYRKIHVSLLVTEQELWEEQLLQATKGIHA